MNQNAPTDVNPIINSLDYAVNIFLCSSRLGSSIAVFALEWSHAVLDDPTSLFVE